MSLENPASPAPILISVEDAARRLSIGRTLLYELIATDRLRSCKLGKKRLIDSASVVEFAQSLLRNEKGA